MKRKKLPASYVKAQKAAALFDSNREALAAECQKDRDAGVSFNQIADNLNRRNILTKTGRRWTGGNVHMLLAFPKPPAVKPKSKAAGIRDNRNRKPTRRTDSDLGWMAVEHPALEQWRKLGVEWLKTREQGLASALQAMTLFVKFLVKCKLPTAPVELMLSHTRVPSLYQTMHGDKRKRNQVVLNNLVCDFLDWLLARPDFCDEDDFGQLRTSPAFRNPVARMSQRGLMNHSETVRSTLPYGYIEELREMIAEGPDFGDWKWAQGALGKTPAETVKGLLGPTASAEIEDEDEYADKIAPLWFQVDKKLIDKSDPDCVWRIRERVIRAEPGRRFGSHRTETIYEMWSPVRWVALLIKLQLPLRTFQVRMLDSGEADTWCWQAGE